MANIPLRDYLSGIEELIDAGQTDEALAHCRHVLESYPKHIDTYRMMGKAYLEAHRHSEASDIFKRVLSSIPDDFVSHIGMSIVREESGDQDGAIWHMERAFEAQPSNRAVQDELRRLYSKREGYAPPKVRLTRGALARMYAHGDLYNQAISELRGALSEDEQRPDLQVLLAEMYFRTNRQTDAIDSCSKLIEKLPYCLVANRIMVEILQSSKRDVEAQPYLDRVDELDPYAAQVGGLALASSAPADSVNLEQLIIESPAASEQPLPKAWTGALNMPEGGEYQKEELPDWLSLDNLDAQNPINDTQPKDTEPSVLSSLESLDPATGELKESDTKPVAAFVSRNPSTALVDDQVPEWLRELRPATSSLVMPPEAGEVESETEQPGEAEPSPRWTDEFKTAGLDRSMLPDELSEEEPAQSSDEEPVAVSEGGDDSLSWLESLAAEQGAADEELITKPEDRQKTRTLEPWEQSEPEQLATSSKSGVLAWLDELKSEQNEKKETSEPAASWEPEADTAPASAMDAWEPEPEAASDAGSEGTVPAWLQDLSAEVKETGKNAEIAPRPLDEAPDWLDDLRTAPQPVVSAEDDSEPWAEEPVSLEAEEPANQRSLADDWSAPDDLSKLDWLERASPQAEEASTPTAEPATAWVPEAELQGLEGLEYEEQSATAEAQGQSFAADDSAIEEELASETAAAAAIAAPDRASARRTSGLKAAEEAPQRLEQARQALNFNKLADAADHYGYLLRRRLMVDEVIADLSAAVRRNPSDATLWQTLGDAYMRNNQLREALDSYTKAEDLL